jgi:hypothetical protein
MIARDANVVLETTVAMAMVEAVTVATVQAAAVVLSGRPRRDSK